MPTWATVRKEMAEKGLPLFQAIIKYEELLQEKAAQSQGTDQGALAAPPQEGAPPEEVNPPGIPPGVMV